MIPSGSGSSYRHLTFNREKKKAERRKSAFVMSLHFNPLKIGFSNYNTTWEGFKKRSLHSVSEFLHREERNWVWKEFYVLLNVHLGIISVNNQPDAQFVFIYVYFYFLHVSGSHVSINRRINCINTTSGICNSVEMTVWCAGLDETHSHPNLHTDTINSPDDWHLAARNMYLSIFPVLWQLSPSSGTQTPFLSV